MSKFGIKNVWDIKSTGNGGSNILNSNNTFTGKNTFENTGDVVAIKRTNNQSFGIVFKKEDGDRVGYIGTSESDTNKATVWGATGLKLQTTNNLIELNSGTGDCKWESNRNWNQNEENTITRTKDFKYVRFFEKTTEIPQTSNQWKTDLSWTVNGINTEGLHEILIIMSINDVAFSLNGKIVWKNGLVESKSQFLVISDGANEYQFQLVIKPNNQFQIYHKKGGDTTTIQWIRGWIIRGGGLPWKMDRLW